MLEIATERLVLQPLEIEGKVRTAKGVEEMNAALASVIAGMWVGVECGTLRAEFQLQPLASDISTYALPQILSQDLAGKSTSWLRHQGMPPGIEITRSSGTGAELDHTPWSMSSRRPAHPALHHGDG